MQNPVELQNLGEDKALRDYMRASWKVNLPVEHDREFVNTQR